MDRMPLLYYRPRIIMVDDNDVFLDTFSTALEYQGVLETYTNVKTAITEINQCPTVYDDKQKFIYSLESEERDEDTAFAAINYENFLSIASNPKRSQEIAIVIVDYSMPEMNGVEFCELIRNKPCLKIMLTAEADHSIAVNAFNNGVIDKFLTKNSSTVISDVNSSITALQLEYFQRFSQMLYPITDHICNNKDYIKVVQAWIEIFSLEEFYQCSETGSRLGTNHQREPRWLLVATEQQMNVFHDIGKSNGADALILKNLSDRKQLLCLLTEVEKQHPVTRWSQYLFDISGSFTHQEMTYYYAVVEQNPFDWNFEDIESLAQAL